MSSGDAMILIVDDVPTNIHILGDTLAADYQLRIATSGPQALQIAEQCRPDLILLDIMMPGMDGFEVLRRLRSSETLAQVPVIFVTALESPGDESIGLQLGAADYITKPYNPEIVKLRVKNHLEMARQRNLLKEQKNDLEGRNDMLKEALAQIKRLEGIIPICMGCKKIRDDQDCWQQIENYITEHSDALFSHGLCPHCAEEHLEKTREALVDGGSLPGCETVRLVHPEGEDAKFRICCDASPIGIFMTDCTGFNIYSNPRLEEITGLTAAAIQGHGWGSVVHPEDRAEVVRNWAQLVAGARSESHENRLLKPGGGVTTVRYLVSPVKDSSGGVTGFVGSVEDITHLAQAQAEILKLQKLESLGLLAGGIAHDFNNILTGILGNISLAQGLVEGGGKAQAALLDAEGAAERAVGLSRQLLSFAREGEPVKKAVPVRQLVGESVSRALRGSNVQGVIEVPDGIRSVEVDEAQMLQGISNIVLNGAQAMPGGGKLTVSAAEVRLCAPNGLGLPPGEYVRIIIADEGCGIPEHCLGKVFDPYFTTKAESTGLGLASTYSIVTKHNGHVGVVSEHGKGTAVTLHLPSVREVSQAVGAGKTVAAGTSHRGGSILVMDDEQMIRTIAEKMLESLGYRVTSCEGGAEAIALFAAARDAGTPFDAVIMDLTIAGGMGGKEAARHILAFEPRARLVVSSGYCNDPVMSNYEDYGFCSALPKPYKATDISVLLSRILQTKSA